MKTKKVLISIFLFTFLGLLLCFTGHSCAESAGNPIFSNDKGLNPDSVPPEDADKIQKALEDAVEQKNDQEQNQGAPNDNEGSVIEDENGRPQQVTRRDGTVVTYYYSTDEGGKVTSATLSSQGVNVNITNNGINVSQPGGGLSDAPTVNINSSEPIPLTRKDLINYGRNINFDDILEAFEELSPPFSKAKIKTGKNNIPKITAPSARNEMAAALARFSKTVSSALKFHKLGLSRIELRGQDLKAVIILPEKKK